VLAASTVTQSRSVVTGTPGKIAMTPLAALQGWTHSPSTSSYRPPQPAVLPKRLTPTMFTFPQLLVAQRNSQLDINVICEVRKNDRPEKCSGLA